MTRTLIVMAKTPRVGHGKSRLAREAGAVEACRINRAMQTHTLRVARDPRWRTLLAVAPDRDLNLQLPGVWPAGDRVAQGRGDLGMRLARAFARVQGAVAVIGVDCPGIERRDIAAAFAALRQASVVVGPAEDGGFWLLAARSGRAVDFSGVRWSSVHTLPDLERNLDAPPARLRTLRDVDTLADWRAFVSARRS
jgi:uncharacterized protein